MSLFYTARFEQLFPIPLLAFERVDALQDSPPEEMIPRVLAECCGKTNPTDAEIIYFLERLRDDSLEAQERLEKNKPSTSPYETKSLGTSFQKMLNQMDSARLLLWACGFDYAKAEYLYTKADRRVATQVVDDFLRIQQEQNVYLFESALYGFGGKYSNDDQDEMLDMTDMDAASIMAMLAPQ